MMLVHDLQGVIQDFRLGGGNSDPWFEEAWVAMGSGGFPLQIFFIHPLRLFEEVFNEQNRHFEL